MSNIFCEENYVADALANYDTSSTDFVWWNAASSFIASHCNEDRLSLPKFQFR